MIKPATNEGVVWSGDVASPADAEVADETLLIVLPDLDSQRTCKIMSPRLVNQEQVENS